MVKEIRPNYEAPLVGSLPDFLPSLPDIREAFSVLADTGWYYSINGSVYKVPNHEIGHIQVHRTTSLIWSPARQAFLQVPYDCTETSVATAFYGSENDQTPLPWRRLSFFHKMLPQNRRISLLGYNYERDQLGARGTPTWMPNLLPPVYRHPEAPGQQEQFLLAGDLSIIVGLTAFATTRQQMLTTIGSSLRILHPLSSWTYNGPCGAGRTTERGLVVRVGLNSRTMAPERLRAWENGEWGRISA